MAVKKKKFPDMSGDGKITKKDILMAKGVIPKKKKRSKVMGGGMMKKRMKRGGKA
tara:strand:+ start:246 stop:410 length:165 start_codon:yes stop_codon:yes gene_type:complete